MSDAQPSKVPSVEKCPRCGNYIFVDETECSRCGYNVATLEEAIRKQNPIILAAGLVVAGMIIGIVSLEIDNEILRLLGIIAGMGIVLSGSGVYLMSVLLYNPLRRRK